MFLESVGARASLIFYNTFSHAYLQFPPVLCYFVQLYVAIPPSPKLVLCLMVLIYGLSTINRYYIQLILDLQCEQFLSPQQDG